MARLLQFAAELELQAKALEGDIEAPPPGLIEHVQLQMEQQQHSDAVADECAELLGRDPAVVRGPGRKASDRFEEGRASHGARSTIGSPSSSSIANGNLNSKSRTRIQPLVSGRALRFIVLGDLLLLTVDEVAFRRPGERESRSAFFVKYRAGHGAGMQGADAGSHDARSPRPRHRASFGAGSRGRQWWLPSWQERDPGTRISSSSGRSRLRQSSGALLPRR